MRKLLVSIFFIFVITNLLGSCHRDDDDLENVLNIQTIDPTKYDTIVVDRIVHDTVFVDSISYDTVFVDSIIHDTIVLYGFSVLGNSISTYQGYIPEGYDCHYNPSNLKAGDTWWMQFAEISGIPLNSNASWSGSTVSSARKKADSWFFSDRRINDLSRHGTPKYIIVLGGTNDWGCDKCDLGTSYSTKSYKNFSGAYSLLVSKLKAKYPYTDIICCSILPRKQGFFTPNAKGWTIHDGDSCIREIAALYGAKFIDMSDCGIDQPITDYTTDGVHPNAAGMKLVSDCLYRKFF